MSQVLKIIKERRSVREFQAKALPADLTEQLIEALLWAPSAGNLQSRKFYFIYNQSVKEQLVEAAFGQNFLSQAPLVIVACADSQIAGRYGERGKSLYTICDVAASIQNLMLVATELGLASCWVGAFNSEQVVKILKLTENLTPIALVPVGYSAEELTAPRRVDKEQAVKVRK